MHNTSFDRRNCMVNKGVCARLSSNGVMPMPTSAVASQLIRLDGRPVVMIGRRP
jgi:hypothetical protein